MLLFIRSTIFNIFWILWTMVISLAFIPYCFFKPKDYDAAAIGPLWAKVSLWALRYICGITHTITGRENLPKDTGFIIASKHQSAWDTIIFFIIVKDPIFILKKELLSIPLFGRYLKKMRQISIDRSAGIRALRSMIEQTKDRLADRRAIVIFPEGTRTEAGIRTEQYQPGIAALYHKCDVPVVPVALNSGKFWGKGSYIKKPGSITLSILPPIETGLNHKRFIKNLQDTIETESLKSL